MQISARSRPFIAPIYSAAAWTWGAACRLEPMRFSARSSSSAPVTTRRSVRTVFHFLAQRRIEPSGGDCRVKAQMDAVGLAIRHIAGPEQPCLLGGKAGDGCQPGRKEGEDFRHHRARSAPARRPGAHRSRSHPCGCRSRKPRDRPRRNCAARSRSCGKSKSWTAAGTSRSSSARRCSTQRSSSGNRACSSFWSQ